MSVEIPVTLKFPTVAIPETRVLVLKIVSLAKVETPATLKEESNLTGDTKVDTPATLKSFPILTLLLMPTPPVTTSVPLVVV